MIRTTLFLILFAASKVFCQTPAKEPETTQALLSEVHQLRLAIESMTGASQRVQIALYSLQMQDATVARAIQRLDGVRSRCSALENDRAHLAADIKSMENSAASGGESDPIARAVTEVLPGRKRALEEKSAELQSCQTTEAELSGQLRNEQAKLNELQDRITRLDAALAKLGTEGR